MLNLYEVYLMKRKNEVNIEKALMFLEDMRTLSQQKHGPKKLISIRVPENFIQALKAKADFENKKYQNLIVQAIEEFLKADFAGNKEVR